MTARRALLCMISVALVAGLSHAEDCSQSRRSLNLTPFGRTVPPGARVVSFCDYLDLVKSGAAIWNGEDLPCLAIPESLQQLIGLLIGQT